MHKILVSICYLGFLPFAPGTFGSLAGVIIGFFIQASGGFLLFVASIVFLFLIGWTSSHYYIAAKIGRTDPQEIVIDELVGQLIAYLPFSFYFFVSKSESLISLYYDWLIAFILFRFFDILKPWPISWADRLKSALGVMLDDVLAGFYSAVIICGLIAFN